MRKHQPCRVCGNKHTNPASSTLCSECGPKERLENLRIKEEIKQMNKLIEES